LQEKTLLLKQLGDTPVLRIIDFFINNLLFDYSREEILQNMRISRKTLFKIWRELEDSNVVVVTRKIGKAKMYRLNRDNEVVKKLIELNLAVGRRAMKRLSKQSL
jgi:AraC-like DNA-binding protein